MGGTPRKETGDLAHPESPLSRQVTHCEAAGFLKGPFQNPLVAPPPLKESPSSFYIHSLKLTDSPTSGPLEGLAHRAVSMGPMGSRSLGAEKGTPQTQAEWSGGKSGSAQKDLAFRQSPWATFCCTLARAFLGTLPSLPRTFHQPSEISHHLQHTFFLVLLFPV